jgi:SAM-dependent methyltransferase
MDDVATMVPPPHMWDWVGAAEGFLEHGEEFFRYLVEKGELTPGSSVLDVGCGVGKHAIHFAPFLQAGGRYEGFDVEAEGIEWCQSAITSRYPHAQFRHVNVKSEMYSPSGALNAGAFRFPYGDSEFDLVFLGSVFSHMFFPEVTNYVSEIARVLKPGGRMIATGYFIGPYKKQGIAAGTSAFTFSIEHEGSWIERRNPPEAAVAHERPKFRALLEENGFMIDEIRNGQWHKLAVQDQDFFLVRKVG